jgi:hypothetical protein
VYKPVPCAGGFELHSLPSTGHCRLDIRRPSRNLLELSQTQKFVSVWQYLLQAPSQSGCRWVVLGDVVCASYIQCPHLLTDYCCDEHRNATSRGALRVVRPLPSLAAKPLSISRTIGRCVRAESFCTGSPPKFPGPHATTKKIPRNSLSLVYLKIVAPQR